MKTLNHSSKANATLVHKAVAKIETMSSFADRLSDAMRLRGVNTTILAAHLGISYQAVRNALVGKTKSFTASHNAATAQFLRVDESWLATGTPNRRPAIVRANSAEQERLPYEVSTTWTDVPLMSNRVGAGMTILRDHDSLIGHYPVPKAVLERNSISADDCRMLEVTGDSMSPYVDEGGFVLVNLTDRTIRNGEVYAVRDHEHAMIKRLFKQMDGRVRAESYNKDYGIEHLPTDSQIVIIGRVIWRTS